MKIPNRYLIVALLLVPLECFAIKQIAIFSGRDSDHEKQMVANATLKSSFRQAKVVNVLTEHIKCNKKIGHIGEKSDLIITMGPEALNRALTCTKQTPIFATYIHHNAFHQLVDQYKPNPARQIAALYLDPKIGSQFDVIEAVAKEMGFKPKLGILISPLNERLIPIIKKQADKRALEYRFVTVQPNDDPVQAWDNLIKETNILLAIPDPNIFNQHNARGMLLIAQRRRIPVIAYSKSFVSIGALAALYCSKYHVTSELIRVLDKYNTGDSFEFQRNHFSKKYSIAINFHTGLVLGTYINQKQQITKHLPWYQS